MHAIYKPGQGFYTRVCSAAGFAILTLMGVAWLWKLLANTTIIGGEPVYGQATVAVIVLAIVGVLGYFILGVKHRTVDFMIATEGEMKKVNWSTRKEIMGSTALVIAFTVFIAVLCFVFDFIFQMFFQWIHVLES
jgi:preprotein translocase SecE subunit